MSPVSLVFHTISNSEIDLKNMITTNNSSYDNNHKGKVVVCLPRSLWQLQLSRASFIITIPLAYQLHCVKSFHGINPDMY